jgi:hypothetical protein
MTGLERARRRLRERPPKECSVGDAAIGVRPRMAMGAASEADGKREQAEMRMAAVWWSDSAVR